MGQGIDLDAIWRGHSRKVLATLIRLLGDFDRAEEALHDAFLAAAQKWPVAGVPANPAAWLISAGRFRAIDRHRKAQRQVAAQDDPTLMPWEQDDDAGLPDDPLRLIFACCHPALPPEWQVALTLRTVCGLTTEEIARAFLVRTPTLAQRIVRAKQRIAAEGLRYEIPDAAALPARLAPVLRVIYLVFNEGYSAHSGDAMLRTDLSAEAIRLCRLIHGLLPDPEVKGLLGLMLLHDARRPARMSQDGEVILLDDQDRRLWDRALIAEGTQLIEEAFASKQIGPYTLQGAIAAVHTNAPSSAATDWREILGLFTVLLRIAPSPVVQLNRAIALSKVEGAEVALREITTLSDDGPLSGYHLAHVAKADMLRQLDRLPEARAAYKTALDLCKLDPEKRLLARKLTEIAV